MKKSRLIQILSACLLVCYSLGIAGVGTHFCLDDGKFYFHPLLSGLSCESFHTDACHEEHDCHETHDCHEHNHAEGEEAELSQADCCSSSFSILTITGEKEKRADVSAVLVAALLPEAVQHPALFSFQPANRVLRIDTSPGCRQILSHNCTLRI